MIYSLHGVQGVAGSNPVAPTNRKPCIADIYSGAGLCCIRCSRQSTSWLQAEYGCVMLSECIHNPGSDNMPCDGICIMNIWLRQLNVIYVISLNIC